MDRDKRVNMTQAWKAVLCLLFALTFLVWRAAAFAEEIVIGFSGPLSGPAMEYGQDCVNGIDMAINEMNAEGGIKVKGRKYTFRLEKLDDRTDPTKARNNALRFVHQYKSPVIFNPLTNTIAAIMGIPQRGGREFIIAAYSSIHMINDKGHPMVINPTPDFATYAVNMAAMAWDRGYRKLAMVVTLGGYGDAWRKTMKRIWLAKGGEVVGDFPANYYTETDFSPELASALAQKPDVILIGGPSSTTALVIKQARQMGYKGGLIMLDQAKPDYIAKALKNMKMLEGLISTGSVMDLPLPVTKDFSKRYQAAYLKEMTWECALNYNMMHVIARAMEAADSIKAVDARRAISKVLPTPGDKYPNELFGIDENGVMYCGAVVQYVANSKFSKVDYILSFPKSQGEFDQYKKMSKSRESAQIRWSPVP